jgi:hypothetical protein
MQLIIESVRTFRASQRTDGYKEKSQGKLLNYIKKVIRARNV